MSDGRAKNGGARSGAGRKRREQELELHGLLLESWPTSDRRATIERLAEIAKGETKGAVEAAKLLLAYAYGKPIDRQEISGPGGEPLQGYVTISPDDWDNTQAE